MLKWGILGAGRIAGVHAMAITTIPGSRDNPSRVTAFVTRAMATLDVNGAGQGCRASAAVADSASRRPRRSDGTRDPWEP